MFLLFCVLYLLGFFSLASGAHTVCICFYSLLQCHLFLFMYNALSMFHSREKFCINMFIIIIIYMLIKIFGHCNTED